MRGFLLILLVLGCVLGVGAQVEWMKDASTGAIPTGAVTGQINGKRATLAFGSLRKTGGIEFGSPDLLFDHYTVRLRDTDNFITSTFSLELTLTVRRGEIVDGRTFRRISSSRLEDQPGPKGNGVTALAEFYALTMKSRREAKPGQDPFFAGEDSSGSLDPFTGRVEFQKRKGDLIGLRLFVCFENRATGCLAGAAEVSIQ